MSSIVWKSDTGFTKIHENGIEFIVCVNGKKMMVETEYNRAWLYAVNIVDGDWEVTA